MHTWRIPSPINRSPESSAANQKCKPINNLLFSSTKGEELINSSLPFCSFDILDITTGILCSAPPYEKIITQILSKSCKNCEWKLWESAQSPWCSIQTLRLSADGSSLFFPVRNQKKLVTFMPPRVCMLMKKSSLPFISIWSMKLRRHLIIFNWLLFMLISRGENGTMPTMPVT